MEKLFTIDVEDGLAFQRMVVGTWRFVVADHVHAKRE
jgi:hypothetical protein